MGIRIMGALSVALFLVAAPACAQSAKSLDLARRYMAAANMEPMLSSFIADLTLKMAEQQGAKLTSDHRIAFTEATEEATREFMPKIVERILPVIASNFTEAELEAAVVWMESPAGRSFMQKQPALMAKVGTAVEPLAQAYGRSSFERYCKKVGCQP